MTDLIERLRARVAHEKTIPSVGHNAADRERAELIVLLTEAAAALKAARTDVKHPGPRRDAVFNGVIVFPRGQLSGLDKARLEEAGVIAIEVDDPGALVCAGDALRNHEQRSETDDAI